MASAAATSVSRAWATGLSVCILFNVSTMVRALRSLTNSEFLTVGDGEDSTTSIGAVGGLVFESSFESP